MRTAKRRAWVRRFRMGRTATNVLGNAVASAAVAKWDVLVPSSADVSVDDAGGHHKDGIRSDDEGAIAGV